MADNVLVRVLKRIGNAIVDVSLKALIVFIGLAIPGFIGAVWIALRGNPHGPWFYAAAGALVCALIALLIMAALVAIQLSRKTVKPLPQATTQSTPDGLHVRLVQSRLEITSNPETVYKSKLRCEFQNVSGTSIKVRMSPKWTPKGSGIVAKVLPKTLQANIDGRWCPENRPDGVTELHVPPFEHFRAWVAFDEQFTESELQRWCKAKDLGVIELLIDGRAIPFEV